MKDDLKKSTGYIAGNSDGPMELAGDFLSTQKKISSSVASSIQHIFAQHAETYRKKNTHMKLDPSDLFSGVIKDLETTGKGDVLHQLKLALGIGEDDSLQYADVKDISIGYERVSDILQNTLLEQTIPQSHNAIIAKTYAYAFGKLLRSESGGKKIFSNDIVAIYDAVVGSNVDKTHTIADLGYYVRQFVKTCQQKGVSLSKEQHEAMRDFSISFSDMKSSIVEQGIMTKEELQDMTSSQSIQAGSEAERVFASVATLYGVTKLKDAVERRDEVVQSLEKAYQFPGLASLLAKYSPYDELESELLDDNADDAQRQKHTLQSMVVAIKKKDALLGRLLGDLAQVDFDMTKVAPPIQQEYLNFFKAAWTNSIEGKNFLSHLSHFSLDKTQLRELIDDLFDLQKNTLTIHNNAGEDIALSVGKHWMPSGWNRKTANAYMKSGLPIVFELEAEGIHTDTMHRIAGGRMGEEIYIGSEQILPGNYVALQHKDNVQDIKKGYIKKSGSAVVLLANAGDQDGEILQDVSQYKVIEHRDTFLTSADRIPEILAGAAMLKKSVEMTDREHAVADKKLHENILEEILPSAFSGIDESASVNSQNIDKIDFGDAESLSAMTSASLTNADRILKKQLHDIGTNIAKYESNEKSIGEELRIVNDKIHAAAGQPATSQTAGLKATKKELESQRAEALASVGRARQEEQEIRRNADAIKRAIQQKAVKEKALTQQKAVAAQQAEKKKSPAQVAEEDRKKNLEDVVNFWAGLSGDEKAELKPGSSFFVELPTVKNILPGWKHPWAKATIQKVDQDGNITITRSGVDAPLDGAAEGQQSTIYGIGGLEELRGKVGSILKFPSSVGKSRKDWGIGLKAASWNVDKEKKDYIGTLLGNVDFGSWYRKDGNTESSSKSDEIRYIGSVTDDLANDKGELSLQKKQLRYEIVNHDDGKVSITGQDKDGAPYKRTMDQDAFLIFMMDKGLTTYTQKEVDEINKHKGVGEGAKNIFPEIDVSQEIPGKPKKRKRTNFTSLLHCGKITIEGLKKKFKDTQKKEDEELEDIMLSSNWFRKLSKIKPKILGDAFDDMSVGNDSKVDKKKTKEIEEAKKEPDDRSDTSSAGPMNYIDAVMLGPISGGNYGPAKKKPRQAAGLLLYVMEKGNLYPRSLAKYAGKGLWVGAILGPGYQKQYLSWHEDLKHRSEQDPNNEELREKLARSEVTFMKEMANKDKGLKTKLEDDYGKQFWGKTLAKAEGEMFSTKRVDDAYNDNSYKSFGQLYADDIFGPFEQLRMGEFLGTLDLMGDKIKSNALYKRSWNMLLALPILTGLHATEMNEGMKKKYASIARKFGVPFGLYGKDADGQDKMWDLFSLIAQKAGISDNFFLKHKKPDKGLGKGKDSFVKPFYESLTPWRFANGEKLLSYLTDPGKLAQVQGEITREEESAAEAGQSMSVQKCRNQKKLLKDYVDKKCLDDEAGEVGGQKVEGDGVIYQDNVMVLSPGFVATHMMAYRAGKFDDRVRDYAPKLREALTRKISSYSAEKEVSPELYQYVLKKFVDYFSQKGYASKDALQAAIKHSKPGFNSAMEYVISNQFNDQGNNVPPEVMETLKRFEYFFGQKKPEKEKDLMKIFGNVFGKEKGTEQYFKNLAPNNMKIATKQEVKKKNDDIMKRVNAEFMIAVTDDGKPIYKRGAGYCDEFGNDIGVPVQTGKGGKGGQIKRKDSVGNSYTNLDLNAVPERDYENALLAGGQGGGQSALQQQAIIRNMYDNDDEDDAYMSNAA